MVDVNRGNELYKASKAHKLPIVEIAKRAGYDQSMFYRHIKDPNLKFDVLKKYALVIDYSFENEIPEFAEYLKKHSPVKQQNKDETEDLLSKIDYWKDQAFSATKKLNTVLEEKIEMQKEIADLKKEIEQLRVKESNK